MLWVAEEGEEEELPLRDDDEEEEAEQLLSEEGEAEHGSHGTEEGEGEGRGLESDGRGREVWGHGWSSMPQVVAWLSQSRHVSQRNRK